MQCSHPFSNIGFNSNLPNFTQIVPPHTQVIGEGEITSLIFPDGSSHLCFVPTIRHHWTPYQYNTNIASNNNLNGPIKTEYWLIKSVTSPNTTGFSNLSSNIYENSFSPYLFSPNCCVNVPNYTTDYYQTFHNDNTTSTTDIIYFYPNLRQSSIPINSTLVQTSPPIANQKYINDIIASKLHCKCENSFRKREETYDCACEESSSSMSVDGVTHTSKHSLRKKKQKRSKHNRKHANHKCDCGNIEYKDETITTYADRACGNVSTKGRDTQTTQKTKSDIKIEVPIKKKGKKKSNSSMNTVAECVSSCYSDNCDCDSTTETDGK